MNYKFLLKKLTIHYFEITIDTYKKTLVTIARFLFKKELV